MIGTGPSLPAARGPEGFARFAAGLRADLDGLAYLVSGHHGAARAAVAEALRGAGDDWDGDPAAAADRCLLAVVRWSLVLREDLGLPDDEDFWRGGAWALRRLSQDQRVLVALAVHPGFDEEGTARLLDTPRRVVRRRLAAGRTALARLLDLPAGDAAALAAALRQVSALHDGRPDRPID